MDIGPISAIRPVTMVRPTPAAPDLSRVFEVEYLGHSRDDEYSPADRKPGRGLEDEETDEVCEPEPEPEPGPAANSRAGVSLFA